MINKAIRIFGHKPYPSHNVSNGARAKTGNAWLKTIIGRTIVLASGEIARQIAVKEPRTVPASSPSNISLPVTIACLKISEKFEINVSITSIGLGRINFGKSANITRKCQNKRRQTVTTTKRNKILMRPLAEVEGAGLDTPIPLVRHTPLW